MGEKNFIFADFEYTCGREIPESEQELIQFGAVICKDEKFKKGETVMGYVTPVIHPELTDFCKNLTGISQLDVTPYPGTGMPAAIAIDYLYKISKTYDADIYVYGNCDKKVIRLCEDRLIKEGKEIQRISDKIVDIQDVINAAVGRAGMNPRSLIYYANAYDLSTEGAHNAEVDAKLLMQVYKKVIIEKAEIPNAILIGIISEQGEAINKLCSKVKSLEDMVKACYAPTPKPEKGHFGYLFIMNEEEKTYVLIHTKSKRENQAVCKKYPDSPRVFIRDEFPMIRHKQKLKNKGYTESVC